MYLDSIACGWHSFFSISCQINQNTLANLITSAQQNKSLCTNGIFTLLLAETKVRKENPESSKEITVYQSFKI